MTARLRWPASLAARTSLLLLLTALVVYAGAIGGYRLLAERAAETGRVSLLAGHLETAVNELTRLPPEERGAAARALSSSGFRVAWSGGAPIEDATASDPKLLGLHAELTGLVPELAGRRIRLAWEGAGLGGARSVLLGAVQLEDGSYAVFSAAMFPAVIPALPGALLTASLVFVSVTVVAVLILRTLNVPLRRLAAAADRYGREAWVMLPEQGPREIVAVQRAFNAMERRIHRLIEDRTQALASVSHDLRTPIARLRLRCGLLPDPQIRAEWEQDLLEMEAMIESTLAFLRGEADVEKPRLTDLVALLATITDGAVDAGKAATLSAPRRCALTLRPLSIKRAFGNLIENALTYGGAARVAVAPEDAQVRVIIDDDGPGIPEPEIAQAFEPFRRFGSGHGRSNGVGLGLTIAHQAIEREGGSLALSNRPEGGMRAEAILPIRLPSHPS